MTSYIALILGINVGGKNPVSMAELKQTLLEKGFENVSSNINSGNIIFDSKTTDLVKLVQEFENILLTTFSVKTRVAVIPASEMHASFGEAPGWWGEDPGSKQNVIFVIAPAEAKEIVLEVGDAKPDYEKVAWHGHVIFWTAPLETFSRTRWSKIVGTGAYDKVTIRN